MSKKMKMIIIIIAAIIILPILGIVLFIKISDYTDYLASKRRVKEYVSKQHGNVDYHLERSQMGKNAWPADRQEDTFIYYDKTNEFYFRVMCYDSGKNIIDNYDEAFAGSKITKEMHSTFSPEHYMMRCWVTDFDSRGYEDAYCQIVYFNDSKDVDLKALYDMYVFLDQNYPGIEIAFMVSLEKNKREYEDLFSYKKDKEDKVLEEYPNLYFCRIDTRVDAFKTIDAFTKYISGN